MPGVVRLSDIALVVGDVHVCPTCPHVASGPAVEGSNDVFVNSLNAVRKGDRGIHAVCCNKNTFVADAGSNNVFVNGKPLVRMFDNTKHCDQTPGTFITGSPTVWCN